VQGIFSLLAPHIYLAFFSSNHSTKGATAAAETAAIQWMNQCTQPHLKLPLESGPWNHPGCYRIHKVTLSKRVCITTSQDFKLFRRCV